MALAIGSAIAISFAAPAASAWCRTTTTQDFVAPPGGNPCDTAGKPLFWSSKCLSFDVQRDASPAQVDLATARATMQAAFDSWTSADCPVDPVTCVGSPHTGLHPSISVRDLGPVTCDQVEYNQTLGNANMIVFRDGTWPHPDGDVTLALTTVTFSPDSGEIYDADMEINSNPKVNTVTTGDAHVVYDLQSIMTHESGHFLGLAHTQAQNTTSVMYARYKEGATFMRHLAEDDVCAICAAYDPKRSTVCEPTPRHGLALTCGGGDTGNTTKGGCHCALVGQDAGLSPYALSLSALALVVGLARRRKRG